MRVTISIHSWAVLLLGTFLLQACNKEPEEFIPDVSDIPVDLQIRRFEKDLFNLDTNNLSTALPAIEEQYGAFAALYFGQLLGSKDPRIAPQGHIEYVKGFLQYPFVRNLQDTVQIVYGDFAEQRAAFEQAFRYLKYYFPEMPTPDITTFVSEFSIANFIYGEQSLAVGLDFFLGDEYPYQKYLPSNPNFSNYLIRSYNKDHLVSKTLYPLVDDMAGPVEGKRLLDYMISNGKKLYLLNLLQPSTPDTIITEFTPEQLAWCQDNELEIWAYFLQEELLYSSNYQDFRKLIEPSPHSPGMPLEAPGRTANWTGWQIIKAYMKRHPETTVKDLLAIKDAQTILDQSRYRPR